MESEDDYTSTGTDDPAVIQFVDRFKANLIALIEEASWAPAAFSASHSLMPDDVEDRLREKAARNRRRRLDRQEYWRSSKEYEAAIKAYRSAAAPGTFVFPAPAGAPRRTEVPLQR